MCEEPGSWEGLNVSSSVDTRQLLIASRSPAARPFIRDLHHGVLPRDLLAALETLSSLGPTPGAQKVSLPRLPLLQMVRNANPALPCPALDILSIAN